MVYIKKNSARKERHWYLAFIPCVCIVVMAILTFLPFPWHIWNAQISYLCNRNEWQEVINNPAKENLISQTKQRTVIGFPPKNSMLTRYETRTVYISDDVLPQKEMFPMAEQVTVFRKLAPGWFYVQLKY